MIKSIAIAAAVALVGGGVAVAQSQSGAAEVDSLFAQIEEQLFGGDRADAQVRGALAVETTADHAFNLPAGTTYGVVGLCTSSCRDLNLTVYDASGQIVGSDTGWGDAPVVNFTATRGGRYKVTVEMGDCSSAQCDYGVRFYER